MFRWIALCCTFLATPAAWAHPHVFVDVSLRFLANDEGMLTGVDVTWSYDEFFSLLVLEDRGLDPDADMILNKPERAALLGFDLTDWPDGFEGALFLFEGGQKVALDPPKATYADVQAGRIVTRHTRTFAPMPVDALVGQSYDPSYYAALTLRQVTGLPPECAVAVERPDTTAADAIVAKLGNSADEGFFEEVQVGIHYADTFEVTCAASS